MQTTLRRPLTMRLFSRLLISHFVPPLVLTFALALALTALVRVGVILGTLNETELETLRDEGELHRAAWGLDVDLRHALVACAREEPPGDVRSAIEQKTAALQTLFTRAARVPEPMREVVSEYLSYASEALSGNTCETLHGATMQARRAQLDERLTDLWVARLGELHEAVTTKENDAQRIVMSAASMGIPLALASFVLAMWIARKMARLIEEPLASLARAAQRVGRGDFDTPAVVQGPPEILALAEDLERMRCQLQQLETLKQGFLASVSHELRTPLSKIREGLALLQDGALGDLDPKKLRVVQIARAACEREIRMVTTLLDLSRLRAGSPIRLRDATSIDGVLYAAIDGERGEAQQRGVTVELLTTGESVSCRLDPALMERAIANLVRNAVAVSSRGQTVRIERTVEPGHATEAPTMVRIVVRDQGPGVPAEVRANLFDAFVTHPVPNSSKGFGSGIGLALAREVARAHGGALELLDDPAQPRSGATFCLSVPVEGITQANDLTPRTLVFDSSP